MQAKRHWEAVMHLCPIVEEHQPRYSGWRCKSVHPWGRVSEIQSIKEMLIGAASTMCMSFVYNS